MKVTTTLGRFRLACTPNAKAHVADVRAAGPAQLVGEARIQRVEVDLGAGDDAVREHPRQHGANDGGDVTPPRRLHHGLGAHSFDLEPGGLERPGELEAHGGGDVLALDGLPDEAAVGKDSGESVRSDRRGFGWSRSLSASRTSDRLQSRMACTGDLR